MCPIISFQIYKMVSCCIVHGRRQQYGGIFVLCFAMPKTAPSATIYTSKDLVMMDKYIADFCAIFYIPLIHKLAFYIPHVRILGDHHCGNTFCEAYNNSKSFRDFLLLLLCRTSGSQFSTPNSIQILLHQYICVY